MKNKKLKVVGNGPEFSRIKSLAASNIEFLGYKEDEELKILMQHARAFVFAAEEDFGITVVEAMACGTPIIALNKGGTAETVLHHKTGILFKSQTIESIKSAVTEFEEKENLFDPKTISDHAQQFSRDIFEKRMVDFVNSKSEKFFGNQPIDSR